MGLFNFDFSKTEQRRIIEAHERIKDDQRRYGGSRPKGVSASVSCTRSGPGIMPPYRHRHNAPGSRLWRKTPTARLMSPEKRHAILAAGRNDISD